MGSVGTGFSMSLDGFIARPNGDVGPLFDWYFTANASHEISTGDHSFNVSDEGAELIEQASHATGALVTGRRGYEVANAWGGKHPLDVPIFVVTHTPDQAWMKEGSPFTFVTDGVESAIRQAQAVAGAKTVAVASASIVQQCLRLGLLDEIHIDLAPVLLGSGIRLFDHLDGLEIRLEDAEVSTGPGVTHLTYRVRK